MMLMRVRVAKALQQQATSMWSVPLRSGRRRCSSRPIRSGAGAHGRAALLLQASDSLLCFHQAQLSAGAFKWQHDTMHMQPCHMVPLSVPPQLSPKTILLLPSPPLCCAACSWLSVFRAFHRVYALQAVLLHLLIAAAFTEGAWDTRLAWNALSSAVITHAGCACMERWANAWMNARQRNPLDRRRASWAWMEGKGMGRNRWAGRDMGGEGWGGEVGWRQRGGWRTRGSEQGGVERGDCVGGMWLARRGEEKGP